MSYIAVTTKEQEIVEANKMLK